MLQHCFLAQFSQRLQERAAMQITIPREGRTAVGDSMKALVVSLLFMGWTHLSAAADEEKPKEKEVSPAALAQPATLAEEAVYPTFFFLWRLKNDEEFNFKAICEAADRAAFKGDPRPAVFVNILILDEEENWYIAYFSKGNGLIQNGKGEQMVSIHPPFVSVYLNKKTLKPPNRVDNPLM